MRNLRLSLIVLACVGIAVAIGIGIGQTGGTDDSAGETPVALSRAAVSKPLPDAPAELTALRARVNELDSGGVKALDEQLEALRGHPVVVNLWASWCGPCRHELPFFQRQAVKRGAVVAFLGVNSNDNDGDAGKLAARFPMPYPSFIDRRLTMAGRYGAVGLPATAFYDARGKRVLVHQGGFKSEQQLSDEIERYALS